MYKTELITLQNDETGVIKPYTFEEAFKEQETKSSKFSAYYDGNWQPIHINFRDSSKRMKMSRLYEVEICLHKNHHIMSGYQLLDIRSAETNVNRDGTSHKTITSGVSCVDDIINRLGISVIDAVYNESTIHTGKAKFQQYWIENISPFNTEEPNDSYYISSRLSNASAQSDGYFRCELSDGLIIAYDRLL